MSWIRKHRKKLLITAGVAGVGYICYRCIKAHYTRVQQGEAQLSMMRKAELRAESQMQSHFQVVQQISDTSALSSVLPHLKSQLFDQIDLSDLTGRLFQGKDSPHMLSAKEKLELWENLKILSFTRAFSSLCSLSLMVLLMRVQMNVLARHVYINTARDISVTRPVDQRGGLSMKFQQSYLAFAEYLPHEGLHKLIKDIKSAVEEVLGVKTLRESCSVEDLRQIFASIMKGLRSNKTTWLVYMLPREMKLSFELLSKSMSVDGTAYANEYLSFQNDERMQHILEETRAILDSKEFEEILVLSVAIMIDQVAVGFEDLYQGWKTTSIPLAKLIPHVAHSAESLLDQPDNNRFIQNVINNPELQSFCAMVYAAGEHQID